MQAERAALHSQNARGLARLVGAHAPLCKFRRLTVGQVDKQHALTSIGQFGERAAHLRLGIIGMGGDHQRVVAHGVISSCVGHAKR